MKYVRVKLSRVETTSLESLSGLVGSGFLNDSAGVFFFTPGAGRLMSTVILVYTFCFLEGEPFFLGGGGAGELRTTGCTGSKEM